MIQLADLSDVPQLVALAYANRDENGFSHWKANFDKVCQEVSNSVEDGWIIVDKEDLEVNGMIMLCVSELWWSDTPVLSARLTFVKPEKRTFKRTRQLLKAAMECAIINDIPLVLDLFVNKDVEKKAKLLKYLGFKQIGTHFIFNGE